MTAPLVPPEVNLRGLPWMRLDTSRLLDSDLFALSTGDEFKAAVALWCKSWTQEPAASLPTDDRVLAHLSGAGSKWKKVRAMALRGWVLADDGRLYHPVVAEQALQAWEERQEFRGRLEGQNARQGRLREERAALMADLRAAGVHLAWNAPISEVRDSHARLPAPVTPDSGDLERTCHGDSHGLDGTGRDGNVKAKAVPPTPEPSPGQPVGGGTPAGHAAAALNRAGCRVASHDPRLIEAIGEGVTTDALLEVQRLYPGKPASYVIAIARRLNAEQGTTTPTGATHAGSQPARPRSAAERVEQNIRDARQRDQQRGGGDDDAIDGEAVRLPR